MRRRAISIATAALTASVALAPRIASAEGLFDFLFGGGQKQQQQKAPPQANLFADPFGLNQQPAAPPRPVASSGSGPAFCVRSCGSTIEAAASGNGEHYADSENAFAFRKALRADCTCNGRDPAGLAPVDLTLDASLRQGDMIATTNGLVAYSGARVGAGQTAEFIPIASYPGLTADVRARLGEMKVAPVAAEMIAGAAPLPEASRDLALPAVSVPRAVSPRAKRAEVE
jgi:hypothetical protein